MGLNAIRDKLNPMEPNTRYTLVAAVVMAILGLLTFFILWLAGFTRNNQVTYYTVYFRDHSLGGLQVDSNATMRGIKVGKVSDFQISPSNIEIVRVTLSLDADTPVKTDTEAIVTRNLLTGLANIELVKGSQQSSPLTEVREGETYPVIKEGKAPFDKLATSASSVVENLNNSLARLNGFLSDENAASFSRSLANIEKLTATFSNDAGNKDSLFANLTRLTKTLEKESGEISLTLKDSATQLNLQIANLARELSLAARAISHTADRFDNPRSIIFGPADNGLGPGEKGKSK